MIKKEISKQVFRKIHMFTTKVFIRYYCTVLFFYRQELPQQRAYATAQQ